MLRRMTDWEKRYAEPGYAFGTRPNDFLREQADHLPPGPILCLAEGEGRNAVWLAQRGYDVTAVDLSARGLQKARRLATDRKVQIKTIEADLATFPIQAGAWAGIVSIFAHTTAPVRKRVHASVVAGLRPGGVFLLEAYRPEQANLTTGGPADDDRLVNLERLKPELGALEWILAREVDREVIEGRYHTGRAAVVQLVARKRPETVRLS
jgi:SAM-dependent methyltransferase